MEPAVAVTDLTHYYNSVPAVDGISFIIPLGKTLGLIGPNGAGKSTTIKMLTTLLPITSGAAQVAGFDVSDQPAKVRESIGYVPQLISADWELTAYENLLFSAKLYGLSKCQRERRIYEVLNFMGLLPFADQLVKGFSGGMIRRLEIGQALLHKPAVLFLDEPTVGLDPAARMALWRQIHLMQQEMKMAILLTTHDMDEADRLCDTVALMHLGKIVVMDTPHNLKAAVGPKATLDDVFVLHTGSSIKETGDFGHAKQIRTTISNL